MAEPVVKNRKVSYSYTEQVQMVTSPDLTADAR